MKFEKSVSLDGDWKFQVDGTWYQEMGEAWQKVSLPSLGERPGKGKDRGWFSPGIDDKAWWKVPVPACWDFYSRELHGYEGIGWFRKKAKVPRSWKGSRIFLRFE